MQQPLQLLTDPAQIHEAFSIWRNAMEQHGRRRGGFWWLPKEKIFFRFDERGRSILGLDPAGKDATVELNESDGTENRLAGVAQDGIGRHYLIRQGKLQRNGQSDHIESDVFAERTGLEPVDITIRDEPAERSWHIVTALDVPSADICQNTASFVDRCNLARDPDSAAVARRDDERMAEVFGLPEKGGKIAGQPTVSLNERWRIHGEVWEKLRALLDADGRKLVKPRHDHGYEVDGIIKTQTGNLLLEIKTSAAAADVYEGTGQLTLYPKLLPRLSDYRRILLLPGSPRDPLVIAVRECGVELHHYKFQNDGEKIHVCFSSQFLKLCDLGP
jgi:hypothetical protein